MAGVPLTIVGEGPDRARLERARGPCRSTFLGRVSDSELRDLYASAGVTLLPGEEDFGIVPLEAQACGRPVVAFGRGGARETVIHGVTGHARRRSVTGGVCRGHRSSTLDASFDPAAIRATRNDSAARASATRWHALIHAESA